MKLLFPVLCLILLASCDAPQPQSAPEPTPTTFKATGNTARFNKWIAYYDGSDPSFGGGEFILQEEQPLKAMAGSVPGSFSPEFDNFYTPLFIQSPDKKRYIDMDSYQWSLGEDGEIASSPDQEIDLVDTDQKTVTRIAFRGPSQWIEDAFWKNNTTICLLENSSDKVLSITEIDLQKRSVKSYVYSDTLKQKSGYTRKRIEDATGRDLR